MLGAHCAERMGRKRPSQCQFAGVRLRLGCAANDLAEFVDGFKLSHVAFFPERDADMLASFLTLRIVLSDELLYILRAKLWLQDLKLDSLHDRLPVSQDSRLFLRL